MDVEPASGKQRVKGTINGTMAEIPGGKHKFSPGVG
jgi:hypothetical protein